MRRDSASTLRTLSSSCWPTVRDFVGRSDAGVGDVGDVKEAVDAAEVDEGAICGERADLAGDDVAFFEVVVAALR